MIGYALVRGTEAEVVKIATNFFGVLKWLSKIGQCNCLACSTISMYMTQIAIIIEIAYKIQPIVNSYVRNWAHFQTVHL